MSERLGRRIDPVAAPGGGQRGRSPPARLLAQSFKR
jgi:hypothetical protein